MNFFKLVNIWQSNNQERDCFVHFFRLLAMCWPSAQVHGTITFLFVTLPNIHQLKKCFSLSDSVINLLLIWLLTIPAHLKHVATLPCNLSLMACSADISVSQGSVATYARCGGIFDFDIHLTANLPRNLPVIKILKSVKN